MNKKTRQQPVISILCVCTGNICRSPTAEGVFSAMIEKKGLSHIIRVDSAGTHRYHIGEAPDHRAIMTAKKRGYDLSQLRARQINVSDFLQFDYIFFMDDDNADALRRYCPPDACDRLHYLGEFGGLNHREIADPYYGRERDFIRTLDDIELAAQRALDRILTDHNIALKA